MMNNSGFPAKIMCLFCALSMPAIAADMVYLNGVVLTMDGSNSIEQAVAVTDGRIDSVGSNAEVRKHIEAGTRVVDLDGRTMLPGFIDAHGHFLVAGRNALYTVDLNSPPIGDTKTMDELLDKLRERVAKTPKGEWVIGMGYDDTLLPENRHPTRHDLDQVSHDQPIFIFHISLHIAVANTRALELAGITKTSPQPEGGVIRMDDATGEPDGVLEELPAFWPVFMKSPRPTLEQNLDGANHAARMYAKAGVTTAQSGRAVKEYIQVLEEAVRRGLMPIRLNVYPEWSVAMDIAKGKMKIDPALFDRLRIGAAKIVADGSIQGYTGYLSEPYHEPFHGDAKYRGYPGVPKERLIEMVDDAYAAGVQLAIHGNGDAAIDDIIDAVEAAQRKHGRKDARPIIIHAQMSREDQLDRMKALGIIPSFFVLHTYYWGDRHRDIFMGPERAARMSPARSAIERKMPFTIHCDTPVVPMEPLRLVWSAVNRISTGGAIIGEEQRISVMQALRATTINAAWQNYEEEIKGSIEPGKFADLVILSENPLLFPTAIDEIEVLETIVGGKTIYKR